MRILTVGNMYPPHHLGGYELTWRSSVDHLRRSGHAVRVLTSDYASSGAAGAHEDADVHRALRWYWRDHRFPRMGLRQRVALERHNAEVFARHRQEFRPDVVCWWAMGGMSLSLLEHARAAGLPSIGVVGDDWMLYGPKVDAWMRLFSRRLRPPPRLVERALRLPARFPLGETVWLFNSERTRRTAEGAGLSLRAAVAHPGIDPDLFPPAPAQPWRWRLLYLGRIDPRKGIELAIRAVPRLPDEARLRIVGGGDRQHLLELQELCRELGLEERVTFDEVAREQVAAAYADSDTLLFPVLWEEPWGLVPLEAMAVGRPVLASGRGGSDEYLAHERNCLIFDPSAGAAALAEGVLRLAADAKLRDQLRRGGFATASRYTEADYNRAIEAALERAVRT